MDLDDFSSFTSMDCLAHNLAAKGVQHEDVQRLLAFCSDNEFDSEAFRCDLEDQHAANIEVCLGGALFEEWLPCYSTAYMFSDPNVV